MDIEALLAIDNYDLRKLKKRCNFRDCGKIPSKETIILENNGSQTKEIVAIYFCETHYNRNIDSVMDKLTARCSRGSFLEKRVVDINYVTY